MNHIPIGTTIDLPVDPRPLYIPTGLEVAPGQRYWFEAQGRWRDWYRIVGPTGWRLWPLDRWNRVPGAGFCCLCGCVGSQDRHAFAIGAGCEWTVPYDIAGLRDRQLHLFANDWPGRYANNQALPPDQGGPMKVAITRIA